MYFLVGNILFGSIFMLGIRWAQTRKDTDVITAGAINYIVAFLVSLPEIAGSLNVQASQVALLLGALMGLSYFVCFFFVSYTMRWIGASGATVVAILSIVVPICLGVFLWNERPNALQVTGVVIALLSLLLISHQRQSPKEHLQWHWLVPVVMIVFFLLAGASRVAQEAFRYECQPADRPAFLFAAFVASAAPALALLAGRRKPIRRSELACGAVMGIANIVQVHFILKALGELPGFVVFPVTSAGGLLVP